MFQFIISLYITYNCTLYAYRFVVDTVSVSFVLKFVTDIVVDLRTSSGTSLRIKTFSCLVNGFLLDLDTVDIRNILLNNAQWPGVADTGGKRSSRCTECFPWKERSFLLKIHFSSEIETAKNSSGVRTLSCMLLALRRETQEEEERRRRK